VFFGHQKIVFLLTKIISGKRFPHFFIFWGEDSLGKRTLANYLAKYLLGSHNLLFSEFILKECLCQSCYLIEKKNHPDFFEISQEEEIKIDQIRQIQEIERLKTSRRKIFVLDHGENLSNEAQGALLKTLEEPKTNSIFFLITPFLEKLPKTIISRAQIIRFSPLKREEVKSFLFSFKNSKSLDNQTLEEILDFSCGKPGKAKEMLFSKNELEKVKKIFKIFLEYKEMAFWEKENFLEKMEEKKVLELFFYFEVFLFEVLRVSFGLLPKYLLFHQNDLKTYAQNFAKKDLILLLKELQKLKKIAYFSNVKPHFAFETFSLIF